MDPLSESIASRVDAIIASARARFGHGVYFMELAPTWDELRGRMRGVTTIAELEELREIVRIRLRDLSALRSDSTDAEEADFDRGMEVLDALDNRIQNHDRAMEIMRSRPGTLKTVFPRSGGARFDTPDPETVMRMSPADVRDDALRALEARGRELNADQQDKVDQLLRSVVSEDNPNTDGAYVARRILLTESDAYRSGWQRVVTQAHPVLTGEEVEALRAFEAMERSELRAMNEGTPSAGGYGVPVFIDPTIIMTGQGSNDPILEGASRPQVTTNTWKGVSSAGVTWSFDAEAATVSDDSPTLGQPSIPLYTARGFVPFSIEVGEDYPGFAAEMAKLLGEGYNELLADKLTRGSGSAEPTGLITALDADTTVEVLLATAGAFVAGDVTKVWAALPDRYKGASSWLMSYAIADKVTVLQSYTPSVEAVKELRGRPIAPTSYMTDLTSTVHTNVAVVGDLTKYVAPQRTGMSIELVPHLFDVTFNRPTGQRGWFAYARVGGAPSTNQAFRLLNQT
jgi:HK97 family phage major capsid protein